jgi:hypothetical protein
MEFASEIRQTGYLDDADQFPRTGDLIVANARDGDAAILSVSEQAERAVVTHMLAGRPRASKTRKTT